MWTVTQSFVVLYFQNKSLVLVDEPLLVSPSNHRTMKSSSNRRVEWFDGSVVVMMTIKVSAGGSFHEAKSWQRQFVKTLVT